MTKSISTAIEPAQKPWVNPSFWVLGQRVTLLADHATTGGAFCLIDIYAPPGLQGPPPHFHRDCMESFHLLEGSLELFRDGVWTPLKPGESAIVPIGAVHTFRNAGTTPARVLSVFTPAGFEQFFRDLGTPADTPADSGPPVTPEIIQRVIATAESYGMILKL